MYLMFDELIPALIPIVYSAFLMLSFIYYWMTKKFEVYRFMHLLLILLLPFFLMLSLGGYTLGSAVVLWSIISPIGALLFDDAKHSRKWIVAFFVIVVISGLIQPLLRETINLSVNAITAFSVMNILGPGLLTLYMVFYFVQQRDIYQEQSETLLLNILPKEIAKQLKTGKETVASEYPNASILFADMVGFTPLSSTMSPVAVVELLNEIFTHFDVIVEKYNLEKIKTIGDAYMVASGIPRTRLDHATAIVNLAMDMQRYITQTTFANDLHVKFRIGINSGPVLAGVIGKKKFTYDVWGDTVNTASRMESHGDGGVIQITQTTYELIRDEFDCEPRGTVVVKGKGDMSVWAVTSNKTT